MHATSKQSLAGSTAPDGAVLHYECHRPEQTTLYRLVQQHAASFIAHTEASTGAEAGRMRERRWLGRQIQAIPAGVGAGPSRYRRTV